MTTLSLMVLRTSNPEALLPFYQALGLKFVREQHGSGPLHFACEMGVVVLEIYPPKKGRNDAEFASPMLGFSVDSLEKTLVKLRETGVETGAVYQSETEISCTVRDFDGRVVRLTESAKEN